MAFQAAPTFVFPPPEPVGGVKHDVTFELTGAIETEPPPFATAAVVPGAIQATMFKVGLQIWIDLRDGLAAMHCDDPVVSAVHAVATGTGLVFCANATGTCEIKYPMMPKTAAVTPRNRNARMD
jgi:hypothetical protein